MPLEIDPTVDYAFKKLFGDPANTDLLIHLLNAVLVTPAITEVELLNPFNEKDFAADKLSVLDIKAHGADGVWYNVEVQSRTHTSLAARLAYYSARLYTSQLSDGKGYPKLAPAITICFLKETMFRDVPATHLRFALCDCLQHVELTDRLQVHTIELAKYNFQGTSLAVADDLAKWAFFLNRAAFLESDELRRLLPEPQFWKATGVVQMIGQTPEQRMEYEARRKAELDYRSFLADERREGEAIGESKARKKGLVEQVQMLQDLLLEPISPVEDFTDWEEATLLQRIGELKERLRNRTSQ